MTTTSERQPVHRFVTTADVEAVVRAVVRSLLLKLSDAGRGKIDGVAEEIARDAMKALVVRS